MRILIVPIAALAIAAAPPVIAPPEPAPPIRILPAPAPALVETPIEALARDAAEYAALYDVPTTVALRRLHAQAESVAATERIEARFRGRLAGISIEHRPAYRINVYLTGAEPVAPEHLHVGGLDVPVIFRIGARATRDRVVWAMTTHQAEIRALFSRAPSMGFDPRTGELVIAVNQSTARSRGGADTLREKIEAITGVPVQIRLQDREDRNLGVEGGSRLIGVDPDDERRKLCTTGFVVTDGVRHGIVTAAHCVDTISHFDPAGGETPLDFVAQWGWGYRDVQVHLAPGPLQPLFYADTARTRLRPVTGQRSREATRAGDFVCHRGEKTGYHCAEVELVDFAPAGELCGGACLPTWVTVAGPHCRGGDSGAPVFVGTTAFGIVKGASYRPDKSCAFYFYMSTDYLPAGWSLLLEPPPPATNASAASRAASQ
ncbi:hypothetical protein [Sphingomonas sanxanigenens]|uniref:Peptidase S1 domain-containing protein n=1 Tax=Sphingomonas sanxanigenens DSM 19645 = NX02 TaxID=1123269 RepID=W0A6J6_9SPHN|nr:hypothetical protein [Sphingomonas sanxanigenens]AHE52092.1 hypothetical protein NX02_01650 [Sphingomonas sanxanigenens DSM 19645 = NX02]